MIRSRAAAIVVALLLVAACGEATPPASAPPAPSASAPPAPSAAPPPPASMTPPPADPPVNPAFPDTPAGRQLSWVFGALTASPSDADVAARFSSAFLTQVPPATLVGVLAQIGQAAPFTFEPGAAPPGPLSLVVIAKSAQGPRLRVSITVAAEAPHRIEGLLFRPALDVKPAASWAEVQTSLRAVAPRVSLLAAEIAGGKCTAISSVEPKAPLALGSAFKLYVLDALATQIAAGKHTWDEPLAIDDARKSLPSGDMRGEPAGKTFPLRHFAEQMISVSDNTATDHLLALVGREAVEDAVRASGHANPSRLVPFLSTRDLFALKLLATQDERAAYLAAGTPARRKLLAGLEQRDLAPAMATAGGWTKPVMIDSIEWLASAEDLCKVMIRLKARGDAPATAPVSAILSINPGIPDEANGYRYIGFKGGSEPGVLNVTWLLQRASDGKWLFLTVAVNDPMNPVDEDKALAVAASARDLLSR